MEIREGDVFRFCYTDEYRKKLFEPNHCFDGQLIALRSGDDGLLLYDTFWLHGFKARGDAKCFTIELAQQIGELTYVCNLSDVEKIDAWKAQYFDDADVFDLSYQHRCYTHIALRKGAVRSQAKMRKVIREKIAQERRDIESSLNRIESLSKQSQLVEDGRLDEVYV